MSFTYMSVPRVYGEMLREAEREPARPPKRRKKKTATKPPLPEPPSDSDYLDAEFEDVTDVFATGPSAVDITFSRPKPVPKKPNVMAERLRVQRRLVPVHLLAHVCVVACLSREALRLAREPEIKGMVLAEDKLRMHPPTSLAQPMQLRRFLDGLLSAMQLWGSRFRPGGGLQTRYRDLLRAATTMRGSTTVGTVVFVAALRRAGVNARLVYSIPSWDDSNPKPVASAVRAVKPTSRLGQLRQEMRRIRSGPVLDAPFYPPQPNAPPARFFVEVWNPANHAWVTVDPLCRRVLEEVRPGSSSSVCNGRYVVAVDRRGGVRDVTRRYSLHLNGKLRRHRVDKNDAGRTWWHQVLSAATSEQRQEPSQIDMFEALEFARRLAAEGMPSRMTDFKDHPVYALESQLGAREAIHPKERCGTLRVPGRGGKPETVLPVYKREHVHQLRTPRNWYMRGRILRVGVNPMAVVDAKDADDDDTRLYGEAQTEVFVPPPLPRFGELPTNVFGNIEVFVPSMVPAGGALVQGARAVRAARMLGVAFAPAVVGFEFGKGRTATAKKNGCVVREENAEAVEAVMEYLEEEEAEKAKEREVLVALEAWRVLLAKMRIRQGLDRRHGKVEEEGDQEEEGEQEEYTPGGFVPGENDRDDSLGFGPEENNLGDLPQTMALPPVAGFDDDYDRFMEEVGGEEAFMESESEGLVEMVEERRVRPLGNVPDDASVVELDSTPSPSYDQFMEEVQGGEGSDAGESSDAGVYSFEYESD